MQKDRKHCEKGEMLVIINFSFSHSVFKSLILQTHENKGFFGKGLNKDEMKNKTGRKHAENEFRCIF